MPVIQIEARVSLEQLLQAVEQLPSDELAPFVEQGIALRAQRVAPHLTSNEATLLRQINRGLSSTAQERYEELIAKRDSETLTKEEHDELLTLSDEREQFAADRIAALGHLAQMRGIPVTTLMGSLGLSSPTDD